MYKKLPELIRILVGTIHRAYNLARFQSVVFHSLNIVLSVFPISEFSKIDNFIPDRVTQ